MFTLRYLILKSDYSKQMACLPHATNGSCILNETQEIHSDPWEDEKERVAFLAAYARNHPEQDVSTKDVGYLLSPELSRHIAELTTYDELNGFDETDDSWRNPYAQAKFREIYKKQHPNEDIANHDAAHILSLEVAHGICGVQIKLDDEKMRGSLNKMTNFRLVDRYTNRSVERKLDMEILKAKNGNELSTEASQRAREQFEYINETFETSDPFYRRAKKMYNSLGLK